MAVTLIRAPGSISYVYASNSVSNTVTNNTAETVLNQFYTLPSQSQQNVAAKTLIRLRASGIISTALLNFALTLRLRWGGLTGTVVGTTGSLSVGGSLSSAGWNMEADFVILATGTPGSLDAQSRIFISDGLLGINSGQMANTSPFSIDTSVSSDLVLTAQWGTASASNQFQQLRMVAEIDVPQPV